MSSLKRCEICGIDYLGSKCPKKDWHRKIKKLTELYGDFFTRAWEDDNSMRSEGFDLILVAETDEEIDRASKMIVMPYYARFIRCAEDCDITFETYFAMILSSLPDKFGKNYDKLVEKYGTLPLLKSRCTYAFVDKYGDTLNMRMIENSMFLIYKSICSDCWVINHKVSGNNECVPYKILGKSVKDDYLLGYAKCLAVERKWI